MVYPHLSGCKISVGGGTVFHYLPNEIIRDTAVCIFPVLKRQKKEYRFSRPILWFTGGFLRQDETTFDEANSASKKELTGNSVFKLNLIIFAKRFFGKNENIRA
jgi:hypothetical protein